MMGAAGSGGGEEGIFVWGSGSAGGNGLGNTTNYSSPVLVNSDPTFWTKISVGLSAQVGAIKSDGTAWAWGENVGGVLGLGNTTNYSSPVQIGSASNWTSITFGEDGGGLVNSAGKAYSWASPNDYGKSGHGDTTNRSAPAVIGSLTDWATNPEHGMGQNNAWWTKTDGTIWGLGYGKYIGDNATVNKSSPVKIGTATNWTKLAVANFDGCVAVNSAGKLYSWGRNFNGSLGQGDTTVRSYPVQVGSLTDWTTNISMGSRHCLAVKSDNTLWAWGYNNTGTLGNGGTAAISSPVQIGSLTNWAKVEAAQNFSLAIKTDGTLWAWGQGNGGYLGDGTTVSKSSPIQIGEGTNWTEIYAGTRVAIAKRSNA